MVTIVHFRLTLRLVKDRVFDEMKERGNGTPMQPQRNDVPVLVVGAGPGGLSTAITLARQGVAALLVERRPALSGLPRATVVSTRSMELLRSWGLEERVHARAVDVEWQLFVCETLARAATGTPFPVGLPTRAQSSAISPTAPACVPQDQLEPLLLDHVATLGRTEIALGSEVVALDDGTGGTDVAIRDVDTGKTRVVHARYVVAADGAHSTIRRSLGIAMHGPEDLLGVVTALFRAPLWDVLGEHRYGIYSVTHAEASGTFLPAGRDDRWLYGVTWDRTREQLADFTEARLARQIRLGSGIDDLEPRIERIGSFAFAAQLAERFRADSTFLVGDAAHRVTPRGGTGMNAAIHDGFDLGWKLAWVLHGWAGADLLDAYEAERRPVVEHNLARSADPEGTIRDERELHADLGDRLPHVWMPAAGDRRSTLDLLGPGLTLFTGPEPAAWDEAATAVAGPPVAVRSLDAITARALGIRGAGARLARPDGGTAGWWAGDRDATSMLRAAISALVTDDGHVCAATGDRRAVA
jgi:putative polyketide hydroxylase